MSTVLPYILIAILLSSTTLALGIAALGWRQRHRRSGATMGWLALAIAWWSFMEMVSVAASSPPLIVTMNKLSYLGIAAVPVAWLTFAQAYTGRTYLLTRRNLLRLSILPIIVVVLVLTNEWHHLHWHRWDVVYSETLGFSTFDTVYGPTFWLFTAYAYVLLLAGTALLMILAARASQLHRKQAILIAIASLFPWIANTITVFDVLPFEVGADLTPLVMSVGLLLIGLVLVQYRSLESVPVARDAVIENMDDGILVMDTNGTIVDINPAAGYLLQLNHDAILGQSAHDVLGRHPEIGDIYTVHSQRSVPERYREEATLGRLYKAVSVEVSISHLRSPQNVHVGYLMILRDITNRKQAERAAARRMVELRTLRDIDARISSTLVIDDVLETALNAAMQMSGADAAFITLVEGNSTGTQRVAQVRGGYSQLTVGNPLQTDIGIVGRAIRNRKPELVRSVKTDLDYVDDVPGTHAQMVFPLMTRSGLIGVLNLETESMTAFKEDVFAFVRLLAGRIANALENARLYSTSQTQLAELQTLYEQVSQLEQFKTEMIRVAAHDLRNPISNIQGFLALLQEDSDQLSDDHVEFVQVMINQAEQAQQLASDILSLERLERADTLMEAIDLAAITRDAANAQRRQAMNKGQQVTLNLPDEALMVIGDKALLREAVTNLLTNAIKYTPDGGDIAVNLMAVDDMVRYRVVDSGYGVPDSDQENLFKPFSRIRTVETADIAGTGLGLHLVKNVVERHQGSIYFESVYGEGSTFGFDLPLYTETPEDDIQHAEAEEAGN